MIRMITKNQIKEYKELEKQAREIHRVSGYFQESMKWKWFHILKDTESWFEYVITAFTETVLRILGIYNKSEMTEEHWKDYVISSRKVI